MHRMLRVACLGVVVGSSVAAAVACSSSEETPETPPDTTNEAGADVVAPPDAPTGDVAQGDQFVPGDGAVDAGPKCKTATCALAIGAGPYHTCAVLGDHTVKCWGENTYAELGSGTVAAGNKVTPASSTTPLAVPNLNDAIAIAGGGEASGSAFTCALRAGGAIQCWGSNAYGQLGGVTDASVSPGGALVDADAAAATIDLGYRHGCMVDTAGALRCWGANNYGERGTPPLSAIALPIEAGVAAVSAGFFSTCAVSTTGEIVCFGNNGNGQVNPASVAASSGPNVIDAGASASASGVSAGQLFVCATLDAAASCWGINTGSQLGRTGLFATNPPGSPQFTAGLTPISVTAGGLHACAIMADRGVSCWGNNGRGQAGDFTGKTTVATPGGVGGVGNVVQLSLGYEHSCALTEDGDIYCWGSNTKGQLGPNGDADGGVDTASHPDPVKIPL